jgi:murein DD-endopeptidase MepM/ murein hydrolase activator NlpD
MKAFASFTAFLIAILCGGALCFILAFVVVVDQTIPQLPVWAQGPVEQWMLDIPQDSEALDLDNDGVPDHRDHDGGDDGSDGGGDGGGSGPIVALPGPIGWGDYLGPDGIPSGLPFIGPIKKWGVWYDAPLHGCEFADPKYKNHAGFDFPVNTGTPLYSTMGGQVIWTEYTKGGWGRLLIIQNGDYQIWYAHMTEFAVVAGEIVEPGQLVGTSGGDTTIDPQAGNSSGAHLHYGIKKRTGPDSYVWVDPSDYFDITGLTPWGCAD